MPQQSPTTDTTASLVRRAMRPSRSSQYLRSLTALAAVAIMAACASGGSTSSGSASTSPRRDAYVITAAEIANVGATDAYEAVQKLRPNFLRERGQTSLSDPASTNVTPNVYLNDTKMGDISTLRDIPTDNIVTIKYWNDKEAQSRFGVGNVSGVIQVTTKKG
ncbi:MAG TPA: hypothetical protein VFW89_02250 [Gemmatimonadaceae bacterium]|nr:hypothetical protein [Gemmatimonadaceae bacterium]